jgi:hypothetical protein
MADDAQDVQLPDITPEDFDGEQDTKQAESSPADDKKPVVVEKPQEAEADKESVEADADKPEDKPLGKAEERKTQLNTEIRDLVAQRNALKDEVAKTNQQVYQPATEQELEDEGLNATDAKVEALRQRIEIRDYNDKVADAQLTIESESQRVLNDFPAFNPDSKDYDEELSTEAAQLLEANLVFDPNSGQVIGSNVSPYQLYKTLARAQGISATKGQLKGQQATEQMLANADSTASASPAKKPVDPLTALWEGDL